MQIFKLAFNETTGAIEGFHSKAINSTDALELYELLRSSEIEFAGEGVNNLAIAFKSLDLKLRVLSSARNGNILKIKVGKTTLSDVTAWNFDLDTPGIEDLIEELKVDGTLPQTPTALVINGYKDAIYKNSEDVKAAKASRMSFMEALMSSKKIPDRNFRPAYAGGLISSPANKNRVYENVSSFDISSSYPYSAISQLLPTGPSTEAKREGQRVRMSVKPDGSITMGNMRKRSGAVPTGFIGIFEFKGVKRRDWVKVPMIRETDDHWCGPKAKFDKNGLVSGDLRAAFCQPDLKAFAIQYTWDSVEIEALEVHELAPLPKAARKYIIDCFETKQRATDPVERLKAKTAINTIVGLWGIDPFKAAEVDLLVGDGMVQFHKVRLGEAWSKYAGPVGGNGITSGGYRVWDFRWATYTVAYARLRIVEAEKALAEAGAEVLYCDTDSLKFAGPGREVFEKLNAEVLKKNAAIGIPAEMGVWVDESKDFARACFRGRKFYVNEAPDGEIFPHIAGIYRHHSEAIFKKVSLDDLAFLTTVEIYTSRPEIGAPKNDPFGANRQVYTKPVTFTY